MPIIGSTMLINGSTNAFFAQGVHLGVAADRWSPPHQGNETGTRHGLAGIISPVVALLLRSIPDRPGVVERTMSSVA
jgi:hypothetical protein